MDKEKLELDLLNNIELIKELRKYIGEGSGYGQHNEGVNMCVYDVISIVCKHIEG